MLKKISFFYIILFTVSAFLNPSLNDYDEYILSESDYLQIGLRGLSKIARSKRSNNILFSIYKAETIPRLKKEKKIKLQHLGIAGSFYRLPPRRFNSYTKYDVIGYFSLGLALLSVFYLLISSIYLFKKRI